MIYREKVNNNIIKMSPKILKTDSGFDISHIYYHKYAYIIII